MFSHILLSFGFSSLLKYDFFVISSNIAEYDDPFVQYEISSKWKLLDDLKGRTICPKCKRSREYFCYNCFVPMPKIEDIIPRVELPIKVDIVRRSENNLAQSTSVHAAIVAPEQVSVFNFRENVPSYSDDGKTILIYPGKNSSSLKEYFITHPVSVRLKNECTSNDTELGKIRIGNNVVELPFNRLLFVDGTWRNINAVKNCFKKLPNVVLEKRPSQYWRHQNNSPRWYLATIEAVHQALCEIHRYCAELTGTPVSKCGIEKYDNLLFFFRHKYHVIHSLYEHNKLLAYKRPMDL